MSPKASGFTMQLGPGVEFDLIRSMVDRWGDLAWGIGGDAALLDIPRGEQLVLSTDSAIEQVHFRADWINLREASRRAITAALSDLAAMAATPRGALLALMLPPELPERIDELADGVGDALRAAATPIIGGNVTRGPVLGLTTTVVGSAFAPLSRATAEPGDLLYVTGMLGGPGAAVRAWTEGRTPGQAARQRFVQPVARIAEARYLAARGVVAAIDISDGLASDAAHLAHASDVALEIDAQRLPLVDGAELRDALEGGEEYELLLASRTPLNVDEFSAKFGAGLTLIGRVAGTGASVSISGSGNRVAAARGYDHFSR